MRRRVQYAALVPLLAGVLLLAGPGRAMEQQEEPVDLGSLDSGASQVGQGGFQIHGFGVMGYEANASSGENSFAASALAISLFQSTLSHRLSFFGQLTAHQTEEEPFTGAEGDAEGAESGGTETEIDNLFANWVASPDHGIDVTFGKFDSPLGLERDDAPLNFQATSSFLFDLARPVKFTGIMLHQAVSPRFDGYAIVANGWDSSVDTNTSKTVALYGVWSPSLASHAGLGVINGREGEESLRRTAFVGTLLMQPRPNWVFGGEVVTGRQARLGSGSDRWSGASAFLHHRFTAPAPAHGHWALTVRGEQLDDGDGARSGIPQTLTSWTLSPQLLIGGSFFGPFHYLSRTTLPLPQVALRLDLRWDHSDGEVFDQGGGVAGKNRSSAMLQLVYVF